MALLDKLPLEVLLAVVKWLSQKHRYGPMFYELLPLANVSTSLRQLLLPLLYRDLAFEFPVADNSDDESSETESNAQLNLTSRTRHNAALANSAGCSEYVQRMSLFANEHTNPDDIARAVRDDMDAGSENKWPNLRSYACIYDHEHLGVQDSFSCSDFIRKLEKELPKLRQAPPVTRKVSSDIQLLTFNPPSVSFLTQLTSLRLSCDNQGVDANCLPQFFAPTLADLTLSGANPESVWNIFCDGQEGETVVFASLRHLNVTFSNPFDWMHSDGLPPHLQGATNDALTRRSVWTAGTAGGKPGCRVPLFPVLRTLRCTNMAYDFHDFISRTECHNSLVSLYVNNQFAYFDFDAELFKSLETVEFDASLWDRDEETTGSVDLYKSAFTSLLRAKTNIQRMIFKADARDVIFQVPPNIGCTNLRSLFLGVEIDFKSMLRLLSSLKHLVQLGLNVDYASIYRFDDRRGDTAGDIDELQPPQEDYPLVSSTLRYFTCHLRAPKGGHCYTASYAFELALHLPALENMALGVLHQTDVAFFEALLGRFLQELSGSPYMSDGLLNSKVIPHSSISWHKNAW
ncbi:hypothetical protein GQ54DRAFT_111882 [Martensiomyces pterosporus]|nr:hypothetical protein GQ54DRAFT_111882 [Martensiomyces pterosporus]